MIEVEGPDGSIHEFPDGTGPDVIRGAMAKRFQSAPPQNPQSQPQSSATSPQSSAFQRIDDLVRLFANGATGGLADKFASYMGGQPLEAERARSQAAADRTGLIGDAAKIGGMMLPASKIAKAYQAVKMLPQAAPAVAMATGAGAGAFDAFGNDRDLAQGAALGAGAGLLGHGAAKLAARAITPLPIDAARGKMVDVLQGAGVPLTAGQKTGSKALQYAESHLGDLPLSGGKASAIQEAQRDAFTRAALSKSGIDADRATPEVMNAARQRIGDAFETLGARNTLRMDAPFAQDVGQATQRYMDLTGEMTRVPGFRKAVQDIIDLSKSGAIEGPRYNAMRSALGKNAESLRMSNPPAAEGFRDLRAAVDNAMSRSVSPEDAASWATARREYANLKALEKAVGGAGEGAAFGSISPSQLRSAIASGNKRGDYVRGKGDLAELARAGNAVMAPLPNSGTPARQAAQSLLAAPGAAIGAGMAGAPGAAVGAIAAPLLPSIGGRALMSRPVQSYLGNQAAPKLAELLKQKSGVGPDAFARALMLMQLNAVPASQ